MTHETTIKRIQELVPSVMELEFGCKVILLNTNEDTYKDERGAVCIDVGEDVFDSYPGGEYHLQEEAKYGVYFLNEPWGDCEQTLDSRTNNSGQFIVSKILGKPITLAVIMLAFGKAKIDVGVSVSFRNDGELAHIFPQGVSLKPGPIKNTHISVDTRQARWNLSKDNFNDQSEETKTFIGELLR